MRPRLVNPFRVGVDGSVRVVREKFRRLRQYVRNHPEVGRAAGLVIETGRATPRRYKREA